MNAIRPDESERLLNEAVAATRQVPLPEGPSAEIVSQTLSALRDAGNRSATDLPTRRTPMLWTSRFIALAAAASLAVVFLGVSHFVGGTTAFAEVVEGLSKIRSATWSVAAEVTTLDEKTVAWNGKGMFLAPAHERIEMTIRGTTSIQIADGSQDRVVSLLPATKTAIVIDLKNAPSKDQNPFGKSFLGLRNLAAKAQAGEVDRVERLGTTTIDGRSAEAFRVEIGEIEVNLWADPNTLAPIRVEQRTTAGPKTHIVMSDFRVDVPLDESLFSLEVPEGYTVQQTAQFDFAKKPIIYLAEMLKTVAERNGGIFPANLRGAEGIDGILLRSARESAARNESLTPDEISKQTTDLAMKLGATYGFLFGLTPANDWHYAGKDVKLNAPDRPIFWYRTAKESRVYQVLFADLSIKELKLDELPTVAPGEEVGKP